MGELWRVVHGKDLRVRISVLDAAAWLNGWLRADEDNILRNVAIDAVSRNVKMAEDLIVMGAERDALRAEVERLNGLIETDLTTRRAFEIQSENVSHLAAVIKAAKELLPWAENWLPDEALDQGARAECTRLRIALAAIDGDNNE